MKKVQYKKENIKTEPSYLVQKLTKELFNCFEKTDYPKYRLVEGGQSVMIEIAENKFETLLTHHISSDGVLCNDMETFIKWEEFSR